MENTNVEILTEVTDVAEEIVNPGSNNGFGKVVGVGGVLLVVGAAAYGVGKLIKRKIKSKKKQEAIDAESSEPTELSLVEEEDAK